MKIISKTFKMFTVFLLVIGLTGCDTDDDGSGDITPTPDNIVEIAVANDNLTSLVAALQAADGDLVNVLSGAGPFTVLAPTNAAFDTYLNGTPLDQVDTAVLEQLLLNHVIAGNVTAADLAALSDAQGRGYASTSANGAGGQNLSILFDTSGALPRFNNSASVVSADLADIIASNGTIHVIDAVLERPDIVDHALNNDNFTSLTGALTSENLVTTLQLDGPYTVFAPTNDAFGAFTNPNTNALDNILLNHVLIGTTALSTGLSTSYVNTGATNADGDNLSLYVNVSDDGVMLNGNTMVAVTDIVGTNGVVHVVDNVIDLPTVVTFATADPTFDSLEASLVEADGSAADPMYIPTLLGDGPFTVFAPTNDAFAALLDSNMMWDSPADIDDALLNSVLAHHVIASANVRAEDLTDGAMPGTLEGDMITINLPGNDDNPAKITDGSGNTDVDIVAVNVQAINGVVHAIESVLIPDTTN